MSTIGGNGIFTFWMADLNARIESHAPWASCDCRIQHKHPHLEFGCQTGRSGALQQKIHEEAYLFYSPPLSTCKFSLYFLSTTISSIFIFHAIWVRIGDRVNKELAYDYKKNWFYDKFYFTLYPMTISQKNFGILSAINCLLHVSLTKPKKLLTIQCMALQNFQTKELAWRKPS